MYNFGIILQLQLPRQYRWYLTKILSVLTEVAFTLHAQAAQVQITAPEYFADVAVLIDSKDSSEKT